MLAQQTTSSFHSLLNRIEPEFLGIIGLVSMILFFALLIVSVVTITRTVQKVWIAKMHNQLVYELLAKGHTVDEIQQLLSGRRRNVLFRFFDRREQAYVNRSPSKPVKPGMG